jgi:signal transduction histidine kinase
MTLPLVHTLVAVLFVMSLIFLEVFFTVGSLATNLSLAALHSASLAVVVFLGRFYSGEAALAKEREENVILEKEKTLGRLKDEFVSVISRELKQPTIAIKGYIDRIFSDYSKDLKSESKDLLARTNENSDRLSKLLNDLLDVSQIEKEGLKVNVSNVFLNPILSEVMSNQFFDAKAKRISITQKGDTDVAVNADGDRLKEVLTNLISNAIKYTPEGGKIVVVVENEGEFAKVSVIDNGFGISQEDQKHLFEKFYRIENEQTKSVKGSGLGLFITRNLVEKMGGEIGAISKLGEGTTFFFRLPRYRW